MTCTWAVYRRLRDDPFGIVGMFGWLCDGAHPRDQGDAAGGPSPIIRKHTDTLEPCPDVFMAHGHHLHTGPMLASKVTRDPRDKRLRAMSPSSMGLDEWGLQNLRALQHQRLD